MTTRTIDPTGDDLKRIVATVAADTPVTMLNLLRFRDQAAYPATDDAEPCSGRDAYARYSRQALAHVRAVGGEPVVIAEVLGRFIGGQRGLGRDVACSLSEPVRFSRHDRQSRLPGGDHPPHGGAGRRAADRHAHAGLTRQLVAGTRIGLTSANSSGSSVRLAISASSIASPVNNPK